MELSIVELVESQVDQISILFMLHCDLFSILYFFVLFFKRNMLRACSCRCAMNLFFIKDDQLKMTYKINSLDYIVRSSVGPISHEQNCC